MTEAKEMPAGSAVRKIIRERTREAEDWQKLDAWIAEVGNVDAFVATRRNEVARLEGEEASIRARVNAARNEGEQIVSDAAAEAERIKQHATALMDDAEAAKTEADEVLARANATAKRIVSDAEAEVNRVLSTIKGMRG
jgi:cell division septum initiation protein DivIVA